MGAANVVVIYQFEIQVNDVLQAGRLRLGDVSRAISLISRCRLNYGVGAIATLHGHDVLLNR